MKNKFIATPPPALPQLRRGGFVKMQISLIILHGWGASAKSYEKIKPLLEQKGISVFVFDLPGFGGEPAPDSAWSIDDYADWVAKKLQESGKDKFILFGHSFGGRIAIKLAARQPIGMQKLILCDAAGVTPRPKIKINFFALLSKTGKIIFSLPLLKYFQPIVRKIEYFLAGSRDYYYLQNPIMKGVFKKVIEEDLTKFLSRIKVPTLIVWGGKDRMTPVSDARLMHDKIGGSKLRILDEVGHSPHLECPEKLADVINNFILTD
jgi:pimeloyl-ACP methyl ester carboxylesterase